MKKQRFWLTPAAGLIGLLAVALTVVVVASAAVTSRSGISVETVYSQSCIPAPSGLVSWWPGDGNANDIFDGNSGTLLNGANFASGKVGQAFSFDGVDDQVVIADAVALNPTQITIDAWVKPTSGIPGFGMIVAKGGNGSGFSSQYQFNVSPTRRLAFQSATVFQGPPNLLAASSLPLDTFTHVAVTHDGTTGKLYVNGNIVDQSDFALAPPTAQSLRIGTEATQGSAVFFKGLIDEVQIFSRALSPTEIQAIFNAGSAGKCKAIEVDIDIKPGSFPNSINSNSRGRIPVAILSTADFDAPSEVDKASVTFGRTGDEDSLAKCNKSAEDVNADGLLDQVCHFKTQATGFQAGDTEGILKGQTVDGLPIEGRDSARIVH